MAKIYTKLGDKGETSLVSGKRIPKDDRRIDLYGEVDELNSFIGLLIVKLSSDIDKELLKRVQHNLFNLGSKLACESDQWSKFSLPDVHESLILDVEHRIDEMEEELTPLKNFILPGGCESSSISNVLRTICRRVERKLVGFSKDDTAPVYSLELLNRLSDYFFVLARFENKMNNISDIIWSK